MKSTICGNYCLIGYGRRMRNRSVADARAIVLSYNRANNETAQCDSVSYCIGRRSVFVMELDPTPALATRDFN